MVKLGNVLQIAAGIMIAQFVWLAVTVFILPYFIEYIS